MAKLLRYVFDKDKMEDKQRDLEPVVVKQFLQGYQIDKWATQFKTNDEKRSFNHTRRTVLRHEIMAFSPDSSRYLTSKKLKSFAKFYLKNRCPRSKGVCAVHYEDSIHIHFVISAVGIDGKATRISKEEFKLFKQKLQKFQQEKYPELSDSIVNHAKKKV